MLLKRFYDEKLAQASYLVGCAAAAEPGVFTGDFLFVGDVGRPDLLERAANVEGSTAGAARALFASIERFRGLPDWLQVWPGHGAGSACGKSLGAMPSSTLGYEKRFNRAFRHADEATFAEAHIPGTVNIPLNRSFTTWVGWLLPYDRRLGRRDERARRHRCLGRQRQAGGASLTGLRRQGLGNRRVSGG